MQIAKISFFLSTIFGVSLAQIEEHHHEEKLQEHEGGYEFKYGVEDSHTGDYHTHQEHKHGKEVSGIYTLKEADGTTRVVKYHAGPHSGFNAVVERIGHAHHPITHHKKHHESLEGVEAASGVGGAEESQGHGGNGGLGEHGGAEVGLGESTHIEIGDDGIEGYQQSLGYGGLGGGSGRYYGGHEEVATEGGHGGAAAEGGQGGLGDYHESASSYVGTTHFGYKQ